MVLYIVHNGVACVFFSQIIMKVEMKTIQKEKERFILQRIAKSRSKRKGNSKWEKGIKSNKKSTFSFGDWWLSDVISKTTLASHSLVLSRLNNYLPSHLRLYHFINEQKYTKSFPHPVLLRSSKQFVCKFHILTHSHSTHNNCSKSTKITIPF